MPVENTDTQILNLLTSEEKRFWRLIEERLENYDGTEALVMACGHRIQFRGAPLPKDREYTLCTYCVYEWFKHEEDELAVNA